MTIENFQQKASAFRYIIILFLSWKRSSFLLKGNTHLKRLFLLKTSIMLKSEWRLRGYITSICLIKHLIKKEYSIFSITWTIITSRKNKNSDKIHFWCEAKSGKKTKFFSSLHHFCSNDVKNVVVVDVVAVYFLYLSPSFIRADSGIRYKTFLQQKIFLQKSKNQLH